MAKLSVLAAFLLVALVAGATATRTIITTTVVEDDGATTNPQGQCEKEQMSMEKMRPCMSYLTDMMGGQSTPYPMPRELKVCCSQLKNMDDQCKCEVLEMMMRQKEMGQFRGEEMQKMMQEARMIPKRCGLSTQQCQFRMLSI